MTIRDPNTKPDFAEGAPAEFDPASKGRVPLVPGWYRMRVADFTITTDTEFKYSGEHCILDQLQVTLMVTEGERTGGNVTDFLPLPARAGQTALAKVANQWACFARCLGFTLTKQSMVPAEWRQALAAGADPYETIRDRELFAHVITQTDRDGIEQFGPSGDAYMSVAFFGYRTLSEGPLTPAPTSTAKTAAGKTGAAGKDPDKSSEPVDTSNIGEL